jgi:hypothetical protein
VEPVYEICAVRHAHLERTARHNFIGGDEHDGPMPLDYYLWTIQNVGQASGYRRFNKVDWFREATAKLLNEQQGAGNWKGPKGDVVSTSFALL